MTCVCVHRPSEKWPMGRCGLGCPSLASPTARWSSMSMLPPCSWLSTPALAKSCLARYAICGHISMCVGRFGSVLLVYSLLLLIFGMTANHVWPGMTSDCQSVMQPHATLSDSLRYAVSGHILCVCGGCLCLCFWCVACDVASLF